MIHNNMRRERETVRRKYGEKKFRLVEKTIGGNVEILEPRSLSLPFLFPMSKIKIAMMMKKKERFRERKEDEEEEETKAKGEERK